MAGEWKNLYSIFDTKSDTKSESLLFICREKLWNVRIHDTVLNLCCYQEEDFNIIFAALADGTVAVLEVGTLTNGTKAGLEGERYSH